MDALNASAEYSKFGLTVAKTHNRILGWTCGLLENPELHSSHADSVGTACDCLKVDLMVPATSNSGSEQVSVKGHISQELFCEIVQQFASELPDSKAKLNWNATEYTRFVKEARTVEDNLKRVSESLIKHGGSRVEIRGDAILLWLTSKLLCRLPDSIRRTAIPTIAEHFTCLQVWDEQVVQLINKGVGGFATWVKSRQIKSVGNCSDQPAITIPMANNSKITVLRKPFFEECAKIGKPIREKELKLQDDKSIWPLYVDATQRKAKCYSDLETKYPAPATPPCPTVSTGDDGIDQLSLHISYCSVLDIGSKHRKKMFGLLTSHFMLCSLGIN